jgi:hypothetical protein
VTRQKTKADEKELYVAADKAYGDWLAPAGNERERTTQRLAKTEAGWPVWFMMLPTAPVRVDSALSGDDLIRVITAKERNKLCWNSRT